MVVPVEKSDAVFVNMIKLFPESILHAFGNDVGIFVGEELESQVLVISDGLPLSLMNARFPA